jgi:hypothetical protein
MRIRQGPRLQSGQLRLQRLDLLDRADDLLVGPRRPQHRGQSRDLDARLRQHPSGAGRRERGDRHDQTLPDATDSPTPETPWLSGCPQPTKVKVIRQPGT